MRLDTANSLDDEKCLLKLVTVLRTFKDAEDPDILIQGQVMTKLLPCSNFKGPIFWWLRLKSLLYTVRNIMVLSN